MNLKENNKTGKNTVELVVEVKGDEFKKAVDAAFKKNIAKMVNFTLNHLLHSPGTTKITTLLHIKKNTAILLTTEWTKWTVSPSPIKNVYSLLKNLTYLPIQNLYFQCSAVKPQGLKLNLKTPLRVLSLTNSAPTFQL